MTIEIWEVLGASAGTLSFLLAVYTSIKAKDNRYGNRKGEYI